MSGYSDGFFEDAYGGEEIVGLTGSVKAYKQARANIERADASRAAYFTPNVVITIDGVDRTTAVIISSLRISLALNDEPDTASFTLTPNAGFTATSGETIVIGLGTAVHRIFAGQIADVREVRRTGNTRTWFVEVRCIDWQSLFNRRLVSNSYFNASATTIAADIVDTYTSGFTRRHLEASLATVDEFHVTNEPPLVALRRLANMIEGSCDLDANLDLHFVGSAGETGPLARTNPTTIANTLSTLRAFSSSTDGTQRRTRVICEGLSTTCPVAISTTLFPSLAANNRFEIPVNSFEPFDPTSPGPGLARIGTQRVAHAGLTTSYTPGVNKISSTTTNTASAGDTSLEVEGFFGATSWARVGDQLIYYSGQAGGPARLTGIPASGPGSIQADIGIGAQVEYLPVFIVNDNDMIQADQPEGVEVVMYVQEDDLTAQAALAAIEGGDGVHEVVVSDNRLNTAGATARAQAELALFADAIPSAEWETADMNALPGTKQAIAFTTINALTLTLTITNVELTFPVQDYPPTRRVRGGTVKTSGLFDTGN